MKFWTKIFIQHVETIVYKRTITEKKTYFIWEKKKLKQRLFQYTLNYVNDKHIIIKNTEYTILQGKYLGLVFSPWQLSYCFTSWIEYTMQSIPIPTNLNMKNSIISTHRGMNIHIRTGHHKNIDNLAFFFLVALLSFLEAAPVNLFHNPPIACYSTI